VEGTGLLTGKLGIATADATVTIAKSVAIAIYLIDAREMARFSEKSRPASLPSHETDQKRKYASALRKLHSYYLATRAAPTRKTLTPSLAPSKEATSVSAARRLPVALVVTFKTVRSSFTALTTCESNKIITKCILFEKKPQEHTYMHVDKEPGPKYPASHIHVPSDEHHP